MVTVMCYDKIGGDVDGASKTLIGIATEPKQLQKTTFLIAVSPYIHGSLER